MAYDYEGRGEDIEVNGTTYHIPKLDDLAHAPLAFEDYSNSIPFSEYIVTETVSVDTDIDDSYNGKMIVADASVTLTFGTLKNGFSVACVADGDYNITYEGTDKAGQTQAYEVATVVTVNNRNILSVARAESDNIIIDQGPAEGTPPAPVLVDKDGNEDASGGSVIYFTPGVPDADQAPAIFHSAKIRRQDNAELTTETVTVDQDNMEIAVAGTTSYVYYVVDVYGINEEGKGETASTSAFQLNYNEATGGDVPEGTEYTRVSDGTRWRYHKFTTVGTSTFTITENPNPDEYHVLVVAGGAGGGRRDQRGAGGGGAGGFVENQSATLNTGDVVVGPGGNGGTSHMTNGSNGGDSSIGSYVAKGGGGGGGPGGGLSGGSGGGGCHGAAGGAGEPGQGNNGGSATPNWYGGGGGGASTTGGSPGKGGAGLETTITGSPLTLAGGGGGGEGGAGGSGGGGAGGTWPNAATSGTANTGGGGGGGGGRDGTTSTNGGSGGSGVVIVAYQIAATSTTRQIQQAQAEEAARQAGVEEGIEQGYAQAQEDLQEELTSLRTQISSVGTTDV